MAKKSYSLLFLLSFISFLIFFSPLPPPFSLSLNDSVNQVFYILNRTRVDKEKLAVITIDELSLQKIHQKWPFSRSLYAKALDILKQAKARVVGFDLAFVGESSPQEDKELELALKNFGKKRVVLAYFLDREGRPVYPQKRFQENSLIGFINSPSDSDGKIRRLRGYVKLKDFYDFSWAVKVSAAFREVSPSSLIKEIPLNRDKTFYINYLAKPKDLATLSFYDLLRRNFSSSLLKDKIVLIGPTLNIVHDVQPTPLGAMPGVFVHANGILNILNNKFSKLLPVFITSFILILLLLSTGYILINFSTLRGFPLYLGSLLLLFWVSVVLKFSGWQIPYGRMCVSSLSFFIMGSIYNYLSFLAMLLRIKNKITKDPLTDLLQMRYFCERATLELKRIPYIKKELVIIFLKDMDFILKGEGLGRTREIWRNITSYLFTISNLWARGERNVIVGLKSEKYPLEKIREKIRFILFNDGIRIKVKGAVLELTSQINIRELIPFLIENLEKSQKEELVFKKEDIPSHLYKKEREKENSFSLYLDVEERNRQLLATLEKLKEEEKKTKEVYLELISSLITALESKDPYTQGHSRRVCQYALLLAEKLDLDEEEKDRIRQASLLHDLGKIGIPDAILQKKGKLTDEEFAIIKEHQMMGVKILEPIKEMRGVIPYILHHHESFDGSGYPHGLAGDLIPLGARIIAVADIFDALTTGRSYRNALTKEETLKKLMEMKGGKLDPYLVDKFIETLKEKKII